jgi:hypothetical protein
VSNTEDDRPEPTSPLAATPPPADGTRQPCPSCNGGGYQYIGGREEGEVRCHDCFGSGNAGDGQLECDDFVERVPSARAFLDLHEGISDPRPVRRVP